MDDQPESPEVEVETGDEPEIEVDFGEEPQHKKDYPWAGDDKDVMLRSFIFQTIVDSDDTIIPQVELMHESYQWIKTGEAPKKGKVDRKPSHLKPVPSD